MADQGAKVIHPKAIEAAMKYNVKLSIKYLNNCEGTSITNNAQCKSRKILHCITYMNDRVQLKIPYEIMLKILNMTTY